MDNVAFLSQHTGQCVRCGWGFFFFFSQWTEINGRTRGQIRSTGHSKVSPQHGNNGAAMLPSSICSVCLLAWINVCHGAEGRRRLRHQPPPVSPSSKLPAHVLMTQSNLGDMGHVRGGDRFDVCLLFSAIRELVSDCSFTQKDAAFIIHQPCTGLTAPGKAAEMRGPGDRLLQPSLPGMTKTWSDSSKDSVNDSDGHFVCPKGPF